MKSKIISILIGIGIMGVLVGCSQVANADQADKNGYLQYCGSQNVFNDVCQMTKRIEVYEDTEHDKIVYVSIYNNYTLDIAVTDKNPKSE